MCFAMQLKRLEFPIEKVCHAWTNFGSFSANENHGEKDVAVEEYLIKPKSFSIIFHLAHFTFTIFSLIVKFCLILSAMSFIRVTYFSFDES